MALPWPYPIRLIFIAMISEIKTLLDFCVVIKGCLMTTIPTLGMVIARVVRRFPLPFAMLVTGIISSTEGASVFAGENRLKTPRSELAPPQNRQFKQSLPGIVFAEKGMIIKYVTPPWFTERDTAIDPYDGFTSRSDLSDEAKEFQKKIAEVLSQGCLPNPARVQHFSWLANDPLFQKTVFRMDGWRGVIVEAEEAPDQGWIAKVRMKPCVSPSQGRPSIEDYVEEDYRYQNGRLTLIKTDAAIPKLDKQRFVLY